jgi:hypothetical protein
VGATAQDTVTATATVKTGDFYLLTYTTGDKGTGEDNAVFSFNGPGGVIEQVSAAVPDAKFGYGRYEQYDQFAWNSSGHQTVAYQHVRSITSDVDDLLAIDWIFKQMYEATPAPASWIEALFAMSTTGGLLGSNGNYWAFPRSSWQTPNDFMGTALYGATESGPCPMDRVGYPCFRPWAVPITLLWAQSPANNGPGGQYAYSHGDYSISGSSNWPIPTAVSGNYTEATARTLDPIGQFASYAGDTSLGLSNQSWHWAAKDTCAAGEGLNARNAFFKFHAAQRTFYHFDTLGSSFSTSLYLYDAAAGIACNNRHFFGAAPMNMPASLDGVVDPGDYFVVVDGAGTSAAEGTYQLHVNAMPDGAAMTDPNYDEAVAAFNALGGKLVTVDWSGYTCDHPTTAPVLANTGNQLDKLAIDTGSVDALGAPFQVRVHADDGRCHKPADPPVNDQISKAAINAYNSVAQGRMDVSAIAVDVDDPIDFDGPPGGATQLTPINIDDATFVQSITTVATPETNTKCQQTMPNRFIGCLPGTNVTFNVTFQPPANLPRETHAQIFTFVIRTVRNGTLVLGETPVVIVVPPGPTQFVDAWFIRDYDTTDACPKGTAPLWSIFSWDALTPGNSYIDFEVAVAPSLAELPAAEGEQLLFSNPPGPAIFAMQPIGARAGTPDTQHGGTVVDATLQATGLPRDSKAMRLRAHLVPSSDRNQAPLLRLWNQRISCQPAE